MYCVRCGVKLNDNEKSCPLCGTPVIYEGPLPSPEKTYSYPDRLPQKNTAIRFIMLSLLTAFMAAAALAVLVFCLKEYGSASWSGLVMLGLAFVWVVCIMPLMFRIKNPLIIITVNFLALGGYLLFINGYTGGGWFLSFAFPVIGLYYLLDIFSVILFVYMPGSRLLKAGILFILFGCSFMLVEFFLHITFDAPMFMWSLYPVCILGAIGIFFIVSWMVPSMRETMSKKFFY